MGRRLQGEHASPPGSPTGRTGIRHPFTSKSKVFLFRITGRLCDSRCPRKSRRFRVTVPRQLSPRRRPSHSSMNLAEAFAVLDVSPEAALAEIDSAYKAAVQAWHPDRFARTPNMQGVAEAKLKRLNEAYSVLCIRENPRRQNRHTTRTTRFSIRVSIPGSGRSVRTSPQDARPKRMSSTTCLSSLRAVPAFSRESRNTLTKRFSESLTEKPAGNPRTP